MFEKRIFNKVRNFLLEEWLLNSSKSAISPSDYQNNRLICIANKIFEAFDYNQPDKSVFLDIANAFDRVWHEVLLFKLKSLGVSEGLYRLPEKQLSRRFERVISNELSSSWRPVLAGVFEGSILGPVLFSRLY